MTTVYYGRIIALTAATLLARVELAGGTYPTSSNVSAITTKVFDRNTGLQIGTFSTSPSDAILNSLTLDNTWSEDRIGYNFSLPVPGSYFPSSQTTYRVETEITPTSGPVVRLVFNLECTTIYSNS
jgi:hypothetical protein